ncbi:MAG: LysR family transcriptional regulator [Chloroflexi bacterium]|nr:LysR family transcriptional regulator [Chloroflexota bacterium]
MQPKFNLWLEADGEVVFSAWRAVLLQTVRDTGSISAAAAKLGVQYRTAWQKINEMETRLGVKLVDTQIGGQHGGGARLTPAALDYLDKFNRLNTALEGTVNATFRQTFG